MAADQTNYYWHNGGAKAPPFPLPSFSAYVANPAHPFAHRTGLNRSAGNRQHLPHLRARAGMRYICADMPCAPAAMRTKGRYAPAAQVRL